jgi:hypothetical protein
MQPESNRSGNLQTKETTDHHTAGSLLMRNGVVQSLILLIVDAVSLTNRGVRVSNKAAT